MMRNQVLLAMVFVIVSGCGIKGPPLPPVTETQPAVVEQPKAEVPAPEAIKTIKKKKKTK